MTQPRGSALIIDRKEAPPESSPRPELKPVSKETEVADGTQNSTITVIENPLYEGRTGILLSESLREISQWTELRDVLYIRVKDVIGSLEELRKYERVVLDKGFDVVPYSFARMDIARLPAPSKLPYVKCFIEPDEYARFYGELKEGINMRDNLKAMYELLAKKVPLFSLDGKFNLPKDYANLRI